MTRTSSLYEACGGLFAGYPLAVGTASSKGSARSMVLLNQDGDDAGFLVLTQDHGEGCPSYSLRPWRGPGNVEIGPSSDGAVPDMFAAAIAHGVPLPRHGSIYGWEDGGFITALIAVYAEHTPESPLPSWAAMPLVGIPEAQWPPFVDEPLFGHWFWEHCRAKKIMPLGDLIAATPGVVFWTDTGAILGSGCCAVAHDIRSLEGPMLQRGRYVYYQALRAGKPVPSLRVLLAATGKIDLAPRFRRTGYAEGGSGDVG
jgi:hypothetical protein